MGGSNDWRWMLGVLAIPSLIYSVLVVGVPESPRWLISERQDLSSAKKILSRLGIADPEREVQEIVDSNRHETAGDHRPVFFSARYSRIIWLAFMVAFFNQVSGINFILYYAARPADP